MEIKKSTKQCKCQKCNLKDEVGTNMEVVIIGSVKKYYHKDCFKEYLKEKEFKEKEQKELDILYETVKKIHGVEMLSNYCFILLTDMRNGTYGMNRQNRNYYKYKKGYSYSVINEAYLMCREQIEWSKQNKNFKDFNNEFSYGVAIVSGNLQNAKNRLEQREKNKIAMQVQIDKANEFDLGDGEELFESSYKKPKKSKELDFLD